VPAASDDKCSRRTRVFAGCGWSAPQRSTAAGTALGLFTIVAVALNAPAIGAAAAPHPTVFARSIPHTVEPFRSVGGVGLGFTVAQVNRRFGPPDHRFPVAHRHLAKYVYDDENFEVGFGGAPLRVVWVATYRRQDHTMQGLRIDSSTVAQARRVYPQGLRCTSGGTRPPSPSCTLYDDGDRSRPHMTFDFGLPGHRLGDIELSLPTSRAERIIGTSR
jgi:hypothetical protein